MLKLDVVSLIEKKRSATQSAKHSARRPAHQSKGRLTVRPEITHLSQVQVRAKRAEDRKGTVKKELHIGDGSEESVID